MKKYLLSSIAYAAVAGLGIGVVSPVLAQGESAGTDEIVVSARKRDETAISVPVAIKAFGPKEIERYSLNDFKDLMMLEPNLTVTENTGGGGGAIYVRGMGTTSATNASFDQTVSINVDGIQMSRGGILRLGLLDMAQVEVLKGPQALFFGKNSPAGVISIRTADPTDEFEAMGRVGYEFNAEEKIIEGMVSGPVGGGVGLRLAGSWSDMEGWMENQAGSVAAAANALVPNSIFGPASDTGPQNESRAMRGTLKFDGGGPFTARIKLGFTEVDGIGVTRGGKQRIACPNGGPNWTAHINALAGGPGPLADALYAATRGSEDCSADNRFSQGDFDPAKLVGAPDPTEDAEGDTHQQLILGSIELNQDINDSLQLTSITGYAEILLERTEHFSYSPFQQSAALDYVGLTQYNQITQEIRLASNFATSPVNFLLGAYFQRDGLETYNRNFTGPNLTTHKGTTTAYSTFGQLLWDVTPTVELAGGLRWSYEEKDIDIVRNLLPQNIVPDEASFDDVSPEATLTWRPSDTLTVYGAYKQGFKSGGFGMPYSGGAVVPSPADVSYKPEEVEGFELGVKASLFNGALRVNSAAYQYEFTDLQVNALDNSSGLPVIKVSNAASATLEGLEFDANWLPGGIEGLSIRGAVNWTSAKYDEFDASCYIGQTIAEGCNLGLNPGTGRYTAQSLAGEFLPNASEWSGSFGFTYEHPLEVYGLTLAVSADTSYRSEWNPHPELEPNAMQEEVWFLNGALRLISDRQGWDVSLIGRNLTDEYRAFEAAGAPFSGSGALTGSATTGGRPDMTGQVNRGREILLQLTVRPSEWMSK